MFDSFGVCSPFLGSILSNGLRHHCEAVSKIFVLQTLGQLVAGSSKTARSIYGNRELNIILRLVTLYTVVFRARRTSFVGQDRPVRCQDTDVDMDNPVVEVKRGRLQKDLHSRRSKSAVSITSIYIEISSSNYSLNIWYLSP